MNVFYATASVYVLFGLAHLIFCIRFLDVKKWLALVSMYVLTYAAVLFQFFNGAYLVELAASALSLLFIELVVLRPDEVLDSVVGLQSWKAYLDTLHKIMITKQNVQVLAIKFINAREVKTYLGEDRYRKYIRLIADKALDLAAAEHLEKVDEAEAGVVGTQECGERAHVRLDERGGPEQGEDVVSVRPEQTGDRLPTKGGDPCVDRAVPVVVRELHALGVRVHARVGQDQSPRKPQVKGWTIHLMVDFGEPKIQGAEKQSIQDKRARADAIVSHLDGALAKSIAGEGA